MKPWVTSAIIVAATGLVCAPAATAAPQRAIQRHADALHHALSNDAVKARFRTDGLEAVDMSPEKFNQFLAHEVAPDHKLVSALGLEKR